MEILFMVFMVIVSVMALFAVLVVLRDIVQEILLARREREKAAANADVIAAAERIVADAQAKEAEKAEAPVTAAVEETKAEEASETAEVADVKAEEPTEDVAEAKAEEPAEEAPAEEATAEETPAEDSAEAAAEDAAEAVVDDEGKISFSTRQKQTLEEKYLALSSEQRGWYDEIIKYAANQEGSKRFKNERYEEYKIGNSRLVRMLIKRGIINCEFILHNSDFKNYVNENKISVKQAPTTMLVENAATVDAVKNSIDIVVAAIAEEREYKKKLARERRRAARAASKAEDAGADNANGAVDTEGSAPKDEAPAGV